MALLITSMHFLGQDDQNKVLHELFGYAMPLAPLSASCHSHICMHAI